MNAPVTVEFVLEQLRQLSPADRLKVMSRVLEETVEELPLTQNKPKRSLRGLWKGVSISAEEIDQARREMWGNFPRDDI